jgi:hypothetical protein
MNTKTQQTSNVLAAIIIAWVSWLINLKATIINLEQL